MDGDAALLVRALNDDFRHRGLLELLLQLLADRHVLVQQLAVLALAGEPARVPGAVDTKPQADGIDFLTHGSSSSACARRRHLRTEPADVGVRRHDQKRVHAAASTWRTTI